MTKLCHIVFFPQLEQKRKGQLAFLEIQLQVDASRHMLKLGVNSNLFWLTSRQMLIPGVNRASVGLSLSLFFFHPLTIPVWLCSHTISREAMYVWSVLI